MIEEKTQAGSLRSDERPNSFWSKVYFAVVVTTFFVVTALWAFSRYFA